MPFFDQVEETPEDPIFGHLAAFRADPRPFKINLSIGVYKNEALQTPVLESVKRAEEQILQEEDSKEYLPIDGFAPFVQEAARLLFGASLWKRLETLGAGMQTVGGTGALALGAAFLKELGAKKIFLPDPTWPNHAQIFERVGFEIASYPYYDFAKHTVSFDRMREVLGALPTKSVVVLHTCCHNPTGADLQEREWRELAPLFQKKELIPFFDCAYQGWGKGLEKDVAPLALFAKEGAEMLIASSYAKNFSLYGERAGALFVLTPSSKVKSKVAAFLKAVARANYSNPPMHAAKIVQKILANPPLRQMWSSELGAMRQRVEEMRKRLATTLPLLRDKVGLFSLSGLSPRSVEALIADHAIYMTRDGRINIGALTETNIELVAGAIARL